jgi:hypothetical protein
MKATTIFNGLLLPPLITANEAMNWEDLSPRYQQHLQSKFCDQPGHHDQVIPVPNSSATHSNGADTTHHGGGSGNKVINRKAVAVGVGGSGWYRANCLPIIFFKSKKKNKIEEKNFALKLLNIGNPSRSQRVRYLLLSSHSYQPSHPLCACSSPLLYRDLETLSKRYTFALPLAVPRRSISPYHATS